MPRVNEKDKASVKNEERNSFFSNPLRWLLKKFKTQELSHDEIDSRLRVAIKEKLNLGADAWVWVRKVYDNYCIYEVESNGETKLYKQTYVVDTDDQLLLADGAQEVEEVTSFPLVSPTPNQASNPKGNTMEDAEKKEAVNALIANEKSDYAEEDREELEALSEKTLTNLAGIVANAVEEPAPAEDTAPEPVAKPPVDPKPEDEEAAPQGLSQEQVENIIDERVAKKLAATNKKPILERLEANEKCKLSKEALAGMKQEDLEALEQSLNPGDYSGQGGPRDNDDSEEIPPTPEMNWDDKRKEENIKV